jgi:hypothetical protein
MLVGFLGVLYIPPISELFDISWQPDTDGLVALGVGIVGAALISVARAFAARDRQPHGEARAKVGG